MASPLAMFISNSPVIVDLLKSRLQLDIIIFPIAMFISNSPVIIDLLKSRLQLDIIIFPVDEFNPAIFKVPIPISAWVTGDRNMQKALLSALLMPHDRLKEYQDNGDFTSLM